MKRLESSPLLEAIFAETLRKYVNFLIIRNVENSAVDFSDLQVLPGERIIASTEVQHNDPAHWNTGTSKQYHSLDAFWPERFLESKTEKDSQRESSFVRNEFSTTGLAGIWIPFGGGTSMCPGRHLAKRIMILTLVVLLFQFDMEIVDPDKVAPDMDRYGFGVLQPCADTKTPLRIKRRSL